MRFRTSELATAVDGALHGAADLEVDGVSIDSRAIRPGQLFVPIVADRDGHDFLAAAVAAGAGAVLSQRRADPASPVPTIAVADTTDALQAIGRLARRRLGTLVVGITGSVGKTSVKDLLAACLATTHTTAASERSFNNELGVPLTLANAPDDTAATVLEMGARGRGHIALLCSIGHPTIGIVTAVAAAHTELFGTLDDIAVAKGELVESLPAAGTAVLNADDHRVAAMAARTAANVLRYSTGAGSIEAALQADLTASDIRVDDTLRPAFRMNTPAGSAEVRLGVAGKHQVGNALAAAAAALACGVPLDAIVEGLGGAGASPWRMDLQRSPTGALVLNDAYNANPASMAAALHALAGLDARRRIAVLGVMAELGDRSADDHAAVADLASRLGIELLAVGTDAYGVPGLAGVDDAVRALGLLERGDAVLVKGSRVARMERLAEALLAPPASGAARGARS